jgi:hypothetical protein
MPFSRSGFENVCFLLYALRHDRGDCRRGLGGDVEVEVGWAGAMPAPANSGWLLHFDAVLIDDHGLYVVVPGIRGEDSHVQID